jgi:hypothetical protein
MECCNQIPFDLDPRPVLLSPPYLVRELEAGWKYSFLTAAFLTGNIL